MRSYASVEARRHKNQGMVRNCRLPGGFNATTNVIYRSIHKRNHILKDPQFDPKPLNFGGHNGFFNKRTHYGHFTKVRGEVLILPRRVSNHNLPSLTESGTDRNVLGRTRDDNSSLEPHKETHRP